MSAESNRGAVERALRRAPAHAIPEVLDAAVSGHWPRVTAIRMFVADYHLRELCPVTGGPDEPAVPVRNTTAGRAFASGRPVTSAPDDRPDTAVVYVPLTMRGSRLGVLEVTIARPYAEELVPRLAELGEIVGGALLVAWPHTDRYEVARRRRRLTLAAELQWDLLPGQACFADEYALAGHLEPAYSIGGDNFDWTGEPDHLLISVTNGHGQGIAAALLTSLTVNALRNARRSGADPAEQMSLAGDLVHARYGGDEYTETMMLRVDLADGGATAVDAGSPRILRLRAGQVETVGLEHDVPLGMFPDTRYHVQRFHVLPGDRLLMVSDGVYGARSHDDREFGDQLERSLTGTRLLPAAEVPTAIIERLLEHQAGADLADDAVVVCLDWRGRATA